MIVKNKFPSLCVLIFVFSMLIQGCNFNFSIGNKITEGEAEALAMKTLQNFNRSLQHGDFDDFHQSEMAASVKNDLTTEKLNSAFAAFINKKVDIRPKEGAKMTFTPPPDIDGQYLNLSGSYPAQIGKTMNFKLQYVKESDEWKLKYIDINFS